MDVAHSGLSRGSAGAAGSGVGWAGATCSSGVQKSLGRVRDEVAARGLCAVGDPLCSCCGWEVWLQGPCPCLGDSSDIPGCPLCMRPAEELWGKVCGGVSPGGG